MDRIDDNRTTRYEAAKRGHEGFLMRINATRELWPEYHPEMCGQGSATAVPLSLGQQFVDFLQPRVKSRPSP
jgi:hypothetical protein